MIQKNKAVIGVGNGCKSVVGELCVTGKTALGRGQVRGHLEEVREKAGRYLGEADPGRGNSLCKVPPVGPPLFHHLLVKEASRSATPSPLLS